MKHHFISAALAATALLLSASLSLAVENQAAATGEASSKAGKSEAKPKAAKKIKLVDINSAKKEELKKLPGIGDAEAGEIIAGRPYCSKQWLMVYKIIPDALFTAIQSLIDVGESFRNDRKYIDICLKAKEKKDAEWKAVEQKAGGGKKVTDKK